MNQPPCKDCKDRVLGCHAKCEKYLAYDRENEKLRETRARYSQAFGPSPARAARQREYKRMQLRKGKS